MKPEIREKWLKALTSGEYKQAQGALYSNKQGGHCCLGVLCEVLAFRKQTETKYVALDNFPHVTTQFIVSENGEQVESIQEALNSTVRDLVGLSQRDEDQLIYLNDEVKASFTEIAEFIRRFIKPTYEEALCNQ